MNPAQQVLSALHDDLAAVSEDSVSPEFPETPLGDSLGHRLVIEPMLPLSFSTTIIFKYLKENTEFCIFLEAF